MTKKTMEENCMRLNISTVESEQDKNAKFAADNEILEVLEKNKHILSVEVLGLISIARVLINNFGDEYLMDTAVNYLTYVAPEDDIPEAPDIVEEEE